MFQSLIFQIIFFQTFDKCYLLPNKDLQLSERSATSYNFRKNYKSTDSVYDFSPVTSSAQKLY